MPAFIDITGQTFGRLTVRGMAGRKARRMLWLCDCTCGGTKEVRADSLRSGNTQSCGCIFLEAVKTHGQYLSPVYAVWSAMHARCSNPNHEHWERYGGRGIVVVERWWDYATFAADMGSRPEGTTLERKDNDGPYSPDNCIWASRSAQSRNTSRNRPIRLGGTTKLLTDWCNDLGLNKGTVIKRLNKGWSVKRALTAPDRQNPPRDLARPALNSDLTFGDKTMTIKEWGRQTQISPSLIAIRLGRGWAAERALTTPA